MRETPCHHGTVSFLFRRRSACRPRFRFHRVFLIISQFCSFIKVKRRICSKTCLSTSKPKPSRRIHVRIAYGTQKCPGKLVKTSRGTPYRPITKTCLKTALRASSFVAALPHLLNRLVDVGNLLLSAHDLFLLILFIDAQAEPKSCRRQGPLWSAYRRHQCPEHCRHRCPEHCRR